METVDERRTIDYKKMSIYYTIGSFFNKGIAFITVPIFSRLLTTGEYGIVSTFNAWSGILAVCMGLVLYMGIRASFIDYLDKVDEFQSSVTIFIMLMFGMALAICVLCCWKMSIGLLLPLLCVVQSFSSAIMEDYIMYLMMKYQYKTRTLLMLLPNLISIILSLIIIKLSVFEKTYIGRILPTTLIYFIFTVFVLMAIFKKSTAFNLKYLKFGLSISLPLVVHGIALSVLSQSDRVMITAFKNENETGIYSLVYSFSMIATALTTALSGVWTPWFTNNLKSHNEDDIVSLNKVAKIYTKNMTAVMCAIVLCGPEFLKILSTESYWQGITIIPPLVMSNLIIFRYSFFVDIEHFYKKTVKISINTMIAAVINIILNLIFIPFFGYNAAAYTTLISYCVSLFCHRADARKMEPLLYPPIDYLFDFLLVIIVFILFYLLIAFPVIRWLVGIIILLFNFLTTFVINKNIHSSNFKGR